MAGFVFVLGPCYGCCKPFTFNPLRVPSIVVNGERQPICRECVALANPRRKANGLAEIVPHPDAYEPWEEGEL
jgi:hypothetical protein